MTLSKLSLRNAKRQAADYLIYFVTVILAAALLYAFNGLIFSREVEELSAHFENFTLLIVLASIVVVCIFGWLVSYAMNFMLTRRSRELGLYILVGLENNQVAHVFFVENLLVGGVALGVGLLSGNFLYQVLRAVLMALFGQEYHFQFLFSLRAAGLTMVYFILIYRHALRKSRKKIRTMKIHDLIYFERQNEGVVIPGGKKRRVVFAVSIVSGIAGIFFLMHGGLYYGIFGAALVILFLYGFFLSFASGVPAFFDQRPARKYRGQNLLVFRTLTAKLGTMGIVMATISLLFTALLFAEGMGMFFSGLFSGRAAEDGVFDLYIGSAAEGGVSRDYLEYIEENIPVEDFLLYPVYEADGAQMMEYIAEREEYFWYNYDRDSVMGYNDYAALRKMAGYGEAELLPGQYLLHCRVYLKKILEKYRDAFSVGDQMLTRGGIYTEHFMQDEWGVGNGKGFVLVVPDELLKDCKIRHWGYVAKTVEPVTEDAYMALYEMRGALYLGRERVDENYDSVKCRAHEERDKASFIAMTVFPLYFLAIALMMTTAAILTIQQLAEAKHYKRQFLLLWKLGMDGREMKKAMFGQFALYYLMPALPPVLIGVPVLRDLMDGTEPGIFVGRNSPAMMVGGALLLFFAVYAVYIVVAYSSLKREVLPEGRR